MRKLSHTQHLFQQIRATLRTRTLRVSYLISQDEKRRWGQGPWIDEPDMICWTDKRSNLPCTIMRHAHTGILCGYVGVPASHVMYSVTYSSGVFHDIIALMNGETSNSELTPHGGITWSNYCPWDRDNTEYWYFGYDCGHAFDYAPATEYRMRQIDEMLRQSGHQFSDTWQRLYTSIDRMREIQSMVIDPVETRAESELLDIILHPAYRSIGYCISQCTQLAFQLICPL